MQTVDCLQCQSAETLDKSGIKNHNTGLQLWNAIFEQLPVALSFCTLATIEECHHQPQRDFILWTLFAICCTNFLQLNVELSKDNGGTGDSSNSYASTRYTVLCGAKAALLTKYTEYMRNACKFNGKSALPEKILRLYVQLVNNHAVKIETYINAATVTSWAGLWLHWQALYASIELIEIFGHSQPQNQSCFIDRKQQFPAVPTSNA